jgi:hypothetical protein
MTSTLDKDRLDDLIKVLSSAKTLGFESLSSPVDVLLEAGIDVMLLLKNSFKEGSRGRQNNPSLKFSEKEQDALGNPKQIRIKKPPNVFWSPQLAEIFDKLATFLALIKRNEPSTLRYFNRIKSLVQPPTSEEKSLEESKKTQFNVNLANLARINFHRRQRKRSFSKHSRKSRNFGKKTHSTN